MRLALAGAAVVAALLAVGAGAATKQYSSGRLALPIAAGRTTEHAIQVRETGPVAHVAVWVRLSDSRVGDLTLSLRAPDGTDVLLVQRRGAEGRNIGTGTGCSGQFAVFDDVDAEPLAGSAAPFVDATYRPEERLGALNGKQARGAWTLHVTAAGSDNVGTLQCWELDLTRDVVERKTSSSGAVTASLSFRELGFVYENMRVQIVRRGRTVLAARPARPVGPGWRPVDIRAVDLDGDGEPEVIADYYSGGAHCCTVSEIYRFAGGRYREKPHFWGNPGYRLRGLDADRRPELVTVDDRFFYAFTAYVFSGAPILIFDYDRGALRDVTRRFPGAVARDAARLLHSYGTIRGKREDARGLLAAYVADEYLLGHPERGWRVVDAALRRGDLSPSFAGQPKGAAYVRALRAFLRKTGYAPR